MKKITLLILGCLLMPASLWAQATAVAQITGTIKDQSGALIPGVQITVTQTETSYIRSAITDEAGTYILSNLPVGPYRLEASLPGFNTYVQTGIVLQVNSNPTVNVTLTVGDLSTSVEVQADASMVEVQSGGIGQVIDERRIVDLPLNGRNVTQLISLSGGAVAGTTGASVGNIAASQLNYPTVAVFSVAGGLANQTSYALDGAEHVDVRSNVGLPFPFPDAVQEFKVETSALGAEYGRHPGGTVSAVTRSGTNALHGALFEFVRNGAMNARNAFAPTRDTLKRNQFGGTLGGPILKDKLFFFGGYQGTTERTAPATNTAFVPTAAVLRGDFRAILAPPCQPRQVDLTAATGAVNNVIPQERLHPIALKFLSQVPISDDPCGKLVYGVPTVTNEHQFVGRTDWQRTAKDSVFFRMFLTDFEKPYKFENNLLTVTTATQGFRDRVTSLTLGHTYVINPKVVNSLRLSYSRSVTRIPAPAGVQTMTELGSQMYSPTKNYTGMIQISNYFNVGIFPSHIVVNAYGIADNLNLTLGSHQLALGVGWQRKEMNSDIPSFTNGRMTFTGTNSGNALASFMTGTMETFLQGSDQVGNEREYSPTAYIQDNWQVNSRLRVSAGLRWDPYLPQQMRSGILSAFDPDAFAAKKVSKVFVNAPPGMIFPGDEGFPEGRANSFPEYKNISPRFGLAFDPRGKGTETIRGSYGLFYASSFLFVTQQLSLNSPWGSSITFPGAINMSNPWANYPGGNPFPWPSKPPANIQFPELGKYSFVPLHLKLPYIQHWNLSTEKQFGSDWLAKVAYLGNKTTHQWLSKNVNTPVFVPGNCVAGQYGLTQAGPCSTIANAPARTPMKGYGIVNVLDPSGNATYNGLLLSLNHRFSKNFSALTNYTWSHCINEADSNSDISLGNSYQDADSRRKDRGNCAVDRRNVLNLSLVAESPGIGPSWVRRITQDWSLSGIYSYLSGPYLTVTTGTDVSLTGNGRDRPDLVAAWQLANPTAAKWFNTDAFQRQSAGTYGNAGRGIVLGPSNWNVDMGLWRAFQIRESTKLDVRFEAFNVFNHTRLNLPVLALNSGTFGQILSAKDPRILQLAMKLTF